MCKIGIGSIIEFKDINFDIHKGVVYDNKDILLLGVGKFIGKDTVVSVKQLDIKDTKILDLSNLVRKHAEYDAKLVEGRNTVDVRQRKVSEYLYKNFVGIKNKTTVKGETVENIIKDFSKLKAGDVRRFVSLNKSGKATSELGIVLDDFYVYLLDGRVVSMNVTFIGYKNIKLVKDIREMLNGVSEEVRHINKIFKGNMRLNNLCMDLEANIRELAKSINV